MARHFALVIFNPSHSQETLTVSATSSLNINKSPNLSFKSLSWDCENFLNEIVNCIQFLRSLQSDSHVVLNFVSPLKFSICKIDDAIMAVLLTLETSVQIKSFEFNWIIINSPESENIQNDDLIYTQSTWKENFPFINFVYGNLDLTQQNNFLTIPNTIQLPIIGSVFCKASNSLVLLFINVSLFSSKFNVFSQ